MQLDDLKLGFDDLGFDDLKLGFDDLWFDDLKLGFSSSNDFQLYDKIYCD